MKIKKIIALILVVAVLIACSGCSINLFSVESLLTPPAQSGKNGEVQKAFNELMSKTKYQLKTPVYGEYQTSFVLFDVNADGVEEAFVFYSDSSSIESSVRMAYMECFDDVWSISSDIKGAGNGVYDINFTDLDDDNRYEIIVSWSLLDSKTQVVSVYELSGKARVGGALLSLGNEYCNAKIFLDFNGDKRDDIILVYLDDTGEVQKSYLRMFTLLDKSELFKYGETVLDSAVSSVSVINSDTVTENGEKFSRLFIDCVKNERMLFTEMVYWDASRSVPVRQFTEPSLSNQRNISVKCTDIDNDGLLEIPTLTKLYGDEKTFTVKDGDKNYTFTLLEWQNAEGDETPNVITTLFNPLDLYLYSFRWGSKVTIKYDILREALIFNRWNEKTKKAGEELFSITHRINVAENEILGELLAETENGVYYYQITEEGYSFGITDEIVTSSFIKLN